MRRGAGVSPRGVGCPRRRLGCRRRVLPAGTAGGSRADRVPHRAAAGDAERRALPCRRRGGAGSSRRPRRRAPRVPPRARPRSVQHPCGREGRQPAADAPRAAGGCAVAGADPGDARAGAPRHASAAARPGLGRAAGNRVRRHQSARHPELSRRRQRDQHHVRRPVRGRVVLGGADRRDVPGSPRPDPVGQRGLLQGGQPDDDRRRTGYAAEARRLRGAGDPARSTSHTGTWKSWSSCCAPS